MTNTLNRTRTLTLTAILSAVASVLMFFSINVPLMPSFIKLDFSEIPAVFASFALGPLSGVTVCLVKNMVNLFSTTTMGIGELSNFLLGLSFVWPAGFIYSRRRNFKWAIIAAITGTVTMSILSVFTNFFIVYPVYFNVLPIEAILAMYNVINPFVGREPNSENLVKALITFNMPFTFIKGTLAVFVTFVIYKPLAPVLRGAGRNT